MDVKAFDIKRKTLFSNVSHESNNLIEKHVGRKWMSIGMLLRDEYV